MISVAALAFSLVLAATSFEAIAYTDTEFAFKVSAEQKLKSKIYEYLSQSLPIEDFRVTVNASVFTQEPQTPFADVKPAEDEGAPAMTVDDPADITLGVVQARNMREVLKSRDAIIEGLKKELEKATAPTYAGVEILQLSVYLGLSPSYTPQQTQAIKDKVTGFVADVYRITPKVFVQSLVQEPPKTLTPDEQARMRAPASTPEEPKETPKDPLKDSWMWVAVGLLASLLLSLAALVMRSRLEKKRASAAAAQEKPASPSIVINNSRPEETPRAPAAETPAPAPTLVTPEAFDAKIAQLGQQLAAAQVAQVEKLVQYWSELGADGHKKAAVLLRTWTELMPDKQIHCPMGQEVFEAFKSWKDLALEEKIRVTEEALWELSAVKSMGTEILGSKLERVKKMPASRAVTFIAHPPSREAVYVLWGLMSEDNKQAALRELPSRSKASLFASVWSDDLRLDPRGIQEAVAQIESYLDADPDPMGGASLEDSLSPSHAKRSFVASLDARTEVELFWPRLAEETQLLSELRKETLILSTLAYLKAEFWSFADLLPEEAEFVSLAKLLGSEASGVMLKSMPSLTSRVYESRLRRIEGNLEVLPEDYRNADAYLRRIRRQLGEQKMSPADITRDTTLWSNDSLGNVSGDGRGAQSA
jgi:hypothetical protein